jgi:hypothetical protein
MARTKRKRAKPGPKARWGAKLVTSCTPLTLLRVRSVARHYKISVPEALEAIVAYYAITWNRG